mmetsp:Transcript_12806/g.38653  ORF Transcript_12806/g.38653 Transcript_12806/m.38653 type:complete len:698 (-) Transcript_12806:2204-4297(-)
MQRSRLLRQVLANAAKQLLAADQVAAASGARAGSSSSGLVLRNSLLQRRAFDGGRQLNSANSSEGSAYLRALNKQNNPEAVIAAYESGSVASSEEALGEYVKALVRVNRLDSGALMQTLQRGAAAGAHSSGERSSGGLRMAAQYASEEASGSLAAAGVAAERGTSSAPLYVMQAEPTVWSQFWRTARTLGVAFVVISGLGALMEEKGLSRGMLANPDMKPQMETTTKFADVKGVDEAKGELEEVVEYLKDPARYTVLGGKLPKGVLLVGPPGTGKTMLARAVAGEAGVPFFYCSGSEFEEMFVGVGARRVRDLFAAAKKAAPCIVFIDEIDAVGGSRNPKDQQYMKMTLNQMLVELDGFNPSEGVICMAATNFPESLDKALVRPGRFDWHVSVPNPDIKGRTEILGVHFKNVPRAPDVDLAVIARGTPGFSGADLANLVNIAALRAARDNAVSVTQAALEHAKDRIMMGAERKSAVMSESGRRLTAYHEGGHALVAMHTAGAHPIHKATIVPRGMALGMVMQLPDAENEHSINRQQLQAKLDVAMGGRVAEEIIFGKQDVTTGASSDLEQATRLARAMVCRYGFSEVLGKVSLNYEDMGQTLSSETRAEVEHEVKALLNAAYERASNVLRNHEHELHALAGELLEKESLTGAEIKELITKLNEKGNQGGESGGSGILAKAKGLATASKRPGTAAASA